MSRSGEASSLLEILMPQSAGTRSSLRSGTATSFDANVKMPPVMPLPPPPSAAAAQWAQHAYTASTQAAAAKAAAAKAAEVAAAQAAAAQAAATQAQVAQVSAQQAAAAQVAQSLGYNVAPVGVPTAAAYGDLPSAAPPYGLSSPNPMPASMASMNPLWLLPAALAASCLGERRKQGDEVGSTRRSRCWGDEACEVVRWNDVEIPSGFWTVGPGKSFMDLLG
ncbi:unnamed protein product [Durusdinium trenchii]|uniref:Uncharacterized protein n=2 Tax=Durusdinium trenchii TaxID=1381693 RepID=A0ABP0NYX0_9DINO